MTARRLRLAVPNKGRLQEPTVDFLRAAGLSFELTSRSLTVPVRNVEMDLLFVRTDDIPEMVADRTAELGISGVDLVAEAEAPVQVLAELGYGRCRLAVAVPRHDPVTSIEDLRRQRIATSHPRVVESFFRDKGITIELVHLHGSVEVAPKLGLADAIVDLVSSGSTLLMNELREIETLLDSQAVLVAGQQAVERRGAEIRTVVTMLRAVAAGRRKRYLVMQVPAAATAALDGLDPGFESPTIVPIADDGLVAVRAVVDASRLWSILPELRSLGATGILVLPIEQFIP